MQINIYALVSLLAMVLTAMLCSHAWKRRDAPCAMVVVWMAGSMAVWTGAAAIEAMMLTVPLKYIWSVVAYIGTTATPVFFVMMALEYAGKGAALRRRSVILFLWGIPVCTFLMALTNPWHGLLWRDIVLRESVFGIVGVYVRGIWFWLFMAHAYVLVLGAVVILVGCIFVFPAVFRMQPMLLAFSAIFPLLGNFLYIVNPQWTGGFDFAPFLFSASVMLMGYAVLHGRWLDVMPLPPGVLVDHLREGLCVFDHKNRLIGFNPAASKLLGVSASSIGRDGEVVLSDIGDVLSFPLDEREHVCDVKREKHGQILEILRVGIPVAHGRSCWKLLTIREVTSRRKADQERMMLQQELMQARKLDLVGRITGGVAHEFNNRLMSIMGNAQLSYDLALPEQHEIREFQSEILKVGESTATIIRQLLAYARQQPSDPQTVDINQHISDQFSLLEQVVGSGIKLHWFPGQGVPDIVIDPLQLNQVLVQLVLNAKEACEDRGVVTLRTSYEILPSASFGAVSAKDVREPFVCLDITDTGPGIDPSVAVQLFEPFVTTKGLGRGLGLATVYGIATQNGGHVLTDKLSDGTTRFRVLFQAEN